MTHHSTHLRTLDELSADTPAVLAGAQAVVCASAGPALGTDQDALDLIGQGWGHDASLIVVPVARLDPRFFTLSTGVAGEFMAKFVNYGMRLAVVGDISAQLQASSALRDFVYESNRGRQCWFVRDLAELDERLTS